MFTVCILCRLQLGPSPPNIQRVKNTSFIVNVFWHLVATRGMATLELKTTIGRLQRTSDKDTWTSPGSYSERSTLHFPSYYLHPTALWCHQISPESPSVAIRNDASGRLSFESHVTALQRQRRNASPQRETQADVSTLAVCLARCGKSCVMTQEGLQSGLLAYQRHSSAHDTSLQRARMTSIFHLLQKHLSPRPTMERFILVWKTAFISLNVYLKCLV